MASSDTASKSPTSPSYTCHESYKYFLMPMGFPTENFESGLSYEAQPYDLFVATYPKCGTTWMQNICFLILNDGIPLSSDQKLTLIFPHLEEMGAKYINDPSNAHSLAYRFGKKSDKTMRLIKTHLYHDMTPMHPEAKYIYVARNPKDCLVSFYHHTRGFPKHYNFGNGSFDDYFELFINGNVDFGSYFDNLKSWLPHLNKSNVFSTTYENLVQNPRESILDLAGFLGGSDLQNHLLANDCDILNKVMEKSSFNSMQKDLQRWSSARPTNHTPFIRKGKVGDWRDMLSIEQSERINKKMNDFFSKEDLERLWPNYGSLI